jgi:nitrite reductase (NADH) small subunit
MAFVRAASLETVPPGTMREVSIAGTSVAIANVSGKIRAFNNICLHEGGPLCEGTLSGQNVVCPWHAWEYDVATGKVVGNSEVGVEIYPAEVRDGDIFVDID